MTIAAPKKPDPRSTIAAMPTGAPLYRIARDILAGLGKWQLRALEQYAKKAIDPIDPFMAAQNMASQFIPYINSYLDQGANVARTEMGLQPADDWLVRNPSALFSARNAAYDLCQETVDSFLTASANEIDRLRQEAARSIAAGETAGDLVDSMAKWFNDESRWRARRIANTESARAFNTGQILSTQDLDFVAGYKLVLSADACPLCHAINRLCPVIPKGGSFGQNGKNKTYRNLKLPPFHPNCRCTIVSVFDDEVPDTWPAPVTPSESGYIKPSPQDFAAAEEGGYETVEIGNAKSVTGFVTVWENREDE
jgi:hypothetical protein